MSQVTGVLYWNIQKKAQCLPVLAALVAERKPGVVMLTECPFDEATVLAALGAGFRSVSGAHPWVRFYATVADFAIENDDTSTSTVERMVMARLGTGADTLLLVGVHWFSKSGGLSSNAQAGYAQDFRLLIEAQEKVVGIRKTVVFGDLNLNPYDLGLTDRKRGFRTVPTRRLASQSLAMRKKSELPGRCFYNPMWAWLGDYFPLTADLKPAGSYFWSPKNPEETHWNTLDAVLVSPEALAHFDSATLEIVTTTQPPPPVTPDVLFSAAGALSSKYSDHLPLFFSLTS